MGEYQIAEHKVAVVMLVDKHKPDIRLLAKCADVVFTRSRSSLTGLNSFFKHMFFSTSAIVEGVKMNGDSLNFFDFELF
ncbi:hypothetical protein C1M56_15730 [Vibrio diazotrophicus]|nr:hypothetical protein C1M56_15730 [Vibrio diazotrophicus]